MDHITRNQYVNAHLHNIARDIDQPQSECEAALTQIIVAATNLRENLVRTRDAEITRRRAAQQAKQAHAEQLAAAGHAHA